MTLTRMISAALTAIGVACSAPALAAPASGPGDAFSDAGIILTGSREYGEDRYWRRDGRYDDRYGHRDDGRRYDDRRRGDRDWAYRDDRRRYDRWDDRRPHRWDGHGHGHGHKYGHRYDRGYSDWRPHRHPRAHYWVGRPFHWHSYVIIRDYDYYYLPPPRRGHYYARVDNDVYLIAEGTKRIIDAFVLFDAAARY